VLFDATDTLLLVLPAVSGALAECTFRPDRMRAALSSSMMATDLADYLVRKGLPFRDAHEAVARAVRHAEARGVALDALPLAELKSFAPEIAADVHSVLTLEGSVASRNHPGGTAPEQVRAAVAAARRALAG
jgi:argininosuccinate lyase